MRVIDTSEPFARWYSKVLSEDMRTWQVKLSRPEIETLKQARAICDKAEGLQKDVNQRMGIDDEAYNNDYAWVTICLANILKDQGIKGV